MLVVHEIYAVEAWFAARMGVPVVHENPRYAFVCAPHGVFIGFARSTALHRGPVVTDFGARVALLTDPFGSTQGLNPAKHRTRRA